VPKESMPPQVETVVTHIDVDEDETIKTGR
jgi:hypothetical protein